MARKIRRHDRQRPRQDIRQNQIVAITAQRAVAIADRALDPHQLRNAITGDIMPGDEDRAGINVAGQHWAAQ